MAGYVINRIPQPDRVFTGGISYLWQATGATLVSNAKVSRFDNEGSISSLVTEGDVIAFNKNLSTGLPLSETIATRGIEDDKDTFLVGFWIKSDKALSLNFTVQLFKPLFYGDTTPVEQHSETIYVTSGEWVFVEQVDRVKDPDDLANYPISFNIVISSIIDDGSANIDISFPIIWASLDWVNNPMMLDLYTKLPEFIRNQDSLSTPHPWALARFIEMCIIHQGEMAQVLNDIVYSDISLGKVDSDVSTLSTLVDPTVAPRKYLYWLSQFSGTRLINPTTGATPWANLPATWNGIDLLDGVGTAADAAPWDTIQSSNTEPAGLDEFLKWQASTGYYGVNAGSSEAIIESVKRVLTGTKEITLVVDSPWTLRIQTKLIETPDTSTLLVGDSVAKILELVEPTRPIGHVILHELV